MKNLHFIRMTGSQINRIHTVLAGLLAIIAYTAGFAVFGVIILASS